MAQTSKMMCAFLLCSMARSSEPSVKTLRGFRQNDSLENRSKATGNDILEDEYLQDFNESQLGLQELSATSESYHHQQHHHSHPWAPASYVPSSHPAGGCSGPCTDFVRKNRYGCQMTDKYACQNGQCVYQRTENQDTCDKWRTCKDGTQLICPTLQNCCAYDDYFTCPDGGRHYCNDGTIPCDRETTCR
mmetsp:Transcript_80104/g.141350  ORF Transcript_80104/g.141350 Transcript_80104/m.141350 type:complete len:190 (+) Transcript_80104:71-640(+)